MAEPVRIAISEWAWTKVASNIKGLELNLLESSVAYYKTYRRFGASAPTAPVKGTIPDDAVKIFQQSNTHRIKSSEPLDVYIMCANNDDDSNDIGTILVGNVQNLTDVVLQDQTSPSIILRMAKKLGEFTLDGVQVEDSFTVNVLIGHGASAGHVVCIQEYDTIHNIPRFFQAKIVSVTDTTLTFDRPLDYAFGTGTVLDSCFTKVNIANEVGSIASPVKFSIIPKIGVWDITRIIIQVFTVGTMDEGKFGSIASLTNGITLRLKNSYTYNICNIKSNSSWSSIAYDTKYVDKPPAGTGNGFTCRLTFAGQDKIGVAKRLDSSSDDSLDLIIVDDLSAFGADDQYLVTVEGHVVED